MRKVLVSLVILFGLFCGIIFGAEGDVIWTRTHNGPANDSDRGYGITLDESGNIYVAGQEYVTGQSGNIWVRKYDKDGNEIWTETSQGTDNDGGQGIAVDESGNVYVTGYTWVSLAYEAWIGKYHSSGIPMWTRTAADHGHGIAVDESGNVYVTGYIEVAGEWHNIWVRKYDTDGYEVWTSTYNGTDDGYDQGHGIAVDKDGNVYVAGFEWVSGEGRNIWVRKYDTDGYEIWTSTYNGPTSSDDEGRAVTVDESGNVYVTGHSEGNIWVRKYDTDGYEIWIKTYDAPANQPSVGYGIAVDESGNVYVTGLEYKSLMENANIWVRKYNSDGNEVWTRTHNGTANGFDCGYSIAVDISGNVYVTGLELVTGQSANIWVRKYAGPFAITTTFLPEAKFGSHYSASLSSSEGTPPINWSISSGSLPSGLSLVSNGVISGVPVEGGKFSFTVRAVEKFGAPSEKSLSLRVRIMGASGEVKIQGGKKGYVNPMKGEKAKIYFKPSSAGTVKVKIFTLRGRLVWEKSKNVSGNQDFIEWDCRNIENDVVASGIYVVHVEGPGIKVIKKVAIMK